MVVVSWLLKWLLVSWTWKSTVLEDYHGRWKNCAKTVKWWSEGALRVGMSGYPCLQTEPGLLYSVITGNEMKFWIQPGNKEPEQSVEVSDVAEAKENQSVMLIISFNVRSTVHSKFLPQHQTINQLVYKVILWCMFCSKYDKRQHLWQDKSGLLHCNNTPTPNTEHPPVPGSEEHCYTGTTFLFPWSCSMWHFSFP